MNAGWGALVESASEQIRTDHGRAEAAAETVARDPNRHGVSFTQGFRTGWWQAIEWVLQQQTMWDSLSTSEQVTELGKGMGSIYHPLFADSPRVWADCPTDGRVTVGADGACGACLYDFTKD